MGYQVILSRRVKADLDEIEAYVKRDDPAAAERLVRGLSAWCAVEEIMAKGSAEPKAN